MTEVSPGKFLFALMDENEELFFNAAKDRFDGLTSLRMVARDAGADGAGNADRRGAL